MKDILVLLVLLNAQTTKVCSQPYHADSDGNCLNSTTEYLLDGSNLCCKKCPPGQRLKQECSETTETVCEQCSTGLYMENWNYARNCLSCTKCKENKGLQDGQSCSSTTMSRCVCQPGMYCIMGFDDPYCTACNKYKLCKTGYGVSAPGTKNSNVRCEQCPNGMFSNSTSSTDPCRPHTNCHGRAVVEKGDATSDTVCEPEVLISTTQPQTSTKEPHTKIVFTTASTVMSTVLATASTVMSTVLATSDSKAPRGPTDPTLSISPSVSEAVFNYSTKTPPQNTVSDSTLVIAGVIVFILFIAIILLALYKPVWNKDAARFHPKVDANGNCDSGDEINQGYLVKTQLTSFTETSPEQQCLLQNGKACSGHSQYCNNTETLAQTDGCNSQESIGPLQSTVSLHNPHSALSMPRPLLSNSEPVTPQPSIPTQSSSQPTSPQVLSPVTTSPHVNVNITFNINGSCGTPSVTPTDLMQVDSKLPFGEEERSFSIPQQEAGKQSLMSVQESESYSA
ncbi:tumor necrosis factor receptor superfamily member 1B isoform X2 [Sander lucioperca]|uniref:tumor necrosis factor receptor superfamily member 1B isoform X2 n=1 Tax=Sander lucioperca TaxID=283035 RepID=UPI00125E93C1|nr:tumor necrosis factor receptor superfamily member 1B isoform X2 [Sander lucioperca]